VDAFLEKGGNFSEHTNKEHDNSFKNALAGTRLELSKSLDEYGKSVREFLIDVKKHAIVNFMTCELRTSQREISPATIKEHSDSRL
jgi:hypothetical protein